MQRHHISGYSLPFFNLRKFDNVWAKLLFNDFCYSDTEILFNYNNFTLGNKFTVYQYIYRFTGYSVKLYDSAGCEVQYIRNRFGGTSELYGDLKRYIHDKSDVLSSLNSGKISAEALESSGLNVHGLHGAD